MGRIKTKMRSSRLLLPLSEIKCYPQHIPRTFCVLQYYSSNRHCCSQIPPLLKFPRSCDLDISLICTRNTSSISSLWSILGPYHNITIVFSPFTIIQRLSTGLLFTSFWTSDQVYIFLMQHHLPFFPACHYWTSYTSLYMMVSYFVILRGYSKGNIIIKSSTLTLWPAWQELNQMLVMMK